MAYSYSRINTFFQCKAKYNWSYIDVQDIPFVPSPAMERGTEVHNSVEGFLRGHTEHLHPDIHKHYGQFFLGLRENYSVMPEHRWALDWNWEVCQYGDHNAMIRGFMDLKIVPHEDNLQIYEFKTGKIYPDHDQQKLLYGTAGLCEHPEYEQVDVTGVYFDLKQNRAITYPMEMLPEYKGVFNRQIAEIEACEDFIPEPSYSCRWCRFSKTNGGPCAF